MTDALHHLSIAAASRLIAAGELSPVELTRAYLERIEALNPVLNAYITVTAERAMEQARRAESDAHRARSLAATIGADTSTRAAR